MSSINLNFYADSLKFRTEVRVVLPDYPFQRDPQVSRETVYDPQKRFPVVYLLHGFTGDYTDWCTMMPMEAIAARYGFAVVMPHGYNTWYLNVPDGIQMENFIADELPAAMQAMLPISVRAEERFIAGLSMGGTGAMRIALQHPERYKAAAAMSAVPDPSLPLCEDSPLYTQQLLTSLKACYGGLEGLEDEHKNIMKLALKLKREGARIPPLLFQYGEQDVRFEMQYPRFKAFCEENGLPATCTSAPGGHDFAYWNPTFLKTMEWFREML
ncbi:MAG: hypothetical protein IJD60_05690 [Clostridia bacterium]|nr:hypothetical protein [Clostridia bacterium]